MTICDTVWTVICSSVAFVNIYWQLAKTGTGSSGAAASIPERTDLPDSQQVVNKCMLFR